MAIFYGFHYISLYSREALNPGLSYQNSLDLVLLLNGAGVIGRVLPSYFADHTGPLNLLIPTCLVASVMVLSWIELHTPEQLYVWACFYGIVAGAIMSLYPASLPSLIPDLQRRGALIGLNFTIVSFAVLIGNPIAGAIIAADSRNYMAAQVFMGINFLIGMVLVYLARMVKQRKESIAWWSKI